MTDPEGTQQDAELNPESSTDEATADVNDEATADVTEESWKEAATADYQTRMREFDDVESPPVVSMPVVGPERSP